MSATLLLQYAIVALAVLASAWVVATKQFPGAIRRLRGVCALVLVREGRPGWMHRLGRTIAPAAATAAEGCGGCSACEGTRQDGV